MGKKSSKAISEDPILLDSELIINKDSVQNLSKRKSEEPSVLESHEYTDI